MAPLAPFIRYWSTPAHAAKVIRNVLLNAPGATGVYYDERGKLMLGSAQVRDQQFQDRVVSETRALLATVSAAPPRGSAASSPAASPRRAAPSSSPAGEPTCSASSRPRGSPAVSIDVTGAGSIDRARDQILRGHPASTRS
jgi:hypothetical protein